MPSCPVSCPLESPANNEWCLYLDDVLRFPIRSKHRLVLVAHAINHHPVLRSVVQIFQQKEGYVTGTGQELYHPEGVLAAVLILGSFPHSGIA